MLLLLFLDVSHGIVIKLIQNIISYVTTYYGGVDDSFTISSGIYKHIGILITNRIKELFVNCVGNYWNLEWKKLMKYKIVLLIDSFTGGTWIYIQTFN
jgi:hypothetical protein